MEYFFSIPKTSREIEEYWSYLPAEIRMLVMLSMAKAYVGADYIRRAREKYPEYWHGDEFDPYFTRNM